MTRRSEHLLLLPASSTVGDGGGGRDMVCFTMCRDHAATALITTLVTYLRCHHRSPYHRRCCCSNKRRRKNNSPPHCAATRCRSSSGPAAAPRRYYHQHHPATPSRSARRRLLHWRQGRQVLPSSCDPRCCRCPPPPPSLQVLWTTECSWAASYAPRRSRERTCRIAAQASAGGKGRRNGRVHAMQHEEPAVRSAAVLKPTRLLHPSPARPAGDVSREQRLGRMRKVSFYT